MPHHCWTPYNPALPKPEGLVHVVFHNDTETVVDASQVHWDAGRDGFDDNAVQNQDKYVICYLPVDAIYAQEFKQGNITALTKNYVFTSKLMQKIMHEHAE